MIVYIGNMMSKHGGSVGVIETLSQRFAARHTVVAVSDKKSQAIRLLHMLYTIFKHRKVCQVVLIDSYSTMAFWYTYLAAWLCRRLTIPYIPILHGGMFPSRLQQSPRSTRKVFSNAYANVSPSRYLKEAFEKEGYQVQFIPNSIDLEAYSFIERSHLKPTLLWVRSFHEIYNPQMAVEVLNLACKKYPEATLCMVGGDKDGSMGKVQQLAKEHDLAKQVKFTGFISKTEWIALSKDYDIFINTTNADNQPVSLIEAMALGFPIISTNPGGVPFLVNEGKDALLVDVDDAIGMSEAIFSLLENEGKAKSLSQHSREKAETFAWSHVQHSWWKLLEMDGLGE